VPGGVDAESFGPVMSVPWVEVGVEVLGGRWVTMLPGVREDGLILFG
jgi:hypothetical protein